MLLEHTHTHTLCTHWNQSPWPVTCKGIQSTHNIPYWSAEMCLERIHMPYLFSHLNGRLVGCLASLPAWLDGWMNGLIVEWMNTLIFSLNRCFPDWIAHAFNFSLSVNSQNSNTNFQEFFWTPYTIYILRLIVYWCIHCMMIRKSERTFYWIEHTRTVYIISLKLDMIMESTDMDRVGLKMLYHFYSIGSTVIQQLFWSFLPSPLVLAEFQ